MRHENKNLSAIRAAMTATKTGHPVCVSYVASADPERRHEDLLADLVEAGCFVRHVVAFGPGRAGGKPEYDVSDSVFKGADAVIVDVPWSDFEHWTGDGGDNDDATYLAEADLELADHISRVAFDRHIPFVVAYARVKMTGIINLQAGLDEILELAHERAKNQAAEKVSA